jgi:hypothetical protein
VQIVILNNNRTFVPRNRMAHRGHAGGLMDALGRNPGVTPPVQGGRTATRPGPVAVRPSVRPSPRVNPPNRNSAPHRSAPTRTTRSSQAGQARWNP